MNPIVYHIAGGGAFFTGVALLLVAAGFTLSKQRLWRRLGTFALCLALIAISVSSAPVPHWQLGLALAIAVAWIVAMQREKWGRQCTAAFACVWLAVAAWEASHWIVPHPQPAGVRAVTIVGDSVTAGMGAIDEVTWPSLLAEQHSIAVQDLSGSGFTTSQALARAEYEGVSTPLVIVEIGGNDMLGGRSSIAFRRDLDKLLSLLTQDDRQIVMLELPLIPFYGNYGRVQRTLARKHGVLLVPKRVFLNVIAPKGATRDTIHLTNAGHQAMADAMWRIISTAYDEP